MNDINPLGSTYYAGVQNAASQLNKATKKEKTESTSKLKFADFFKTEKTESTNPFGLPPEIQSMSVEDAAIFLKDRVDEAGNLLNESVSDENVARFKKTVQQFVTFVINNNYEINKKQNRRMDLTSPVGMFGFSKYSVPRNKRPPRVQIELINKKLDELTRGMLYNQRDNLKILASANEIKGLIVDLVAS